MKSFHLFSIAVVSSITKTPSTLTEEPDYLVHLESDADVGVLQSKEWFEWDDLSSSLLAGTSLIFCIHTQVSFKDKTAYRNVSVSGDIFVRNQLKVLVEVGSVDFQEDDSQGNPDFAYLQRHGTAQGLTTPLANGYSLNTPDVSTTSFDQRTVLENLWRY